MFSIGAALGPYRVVAKLGEGGMGNRPPFEAKPLLATPGADQFPEVSPDGVHGFDVAPDGRFLTTSLATTGGGGNARQRIVVAQRWLDAVRRRLTASIGAR